MSNPKGVIMNRILVRAALGIFILFIITSSAFSQWVQMSCPAGDSFSELYANQGAVFARTWKTDSGHLFFTKDNGTNWTEISSPCTDINSPGTDILSLIILDNQIIVGTWDGLYSTMLNNISWEQFSPAGIPAGTPIWSLFKIGDTLFACGIGEMYKSSVNDIDVWSAASTGIPAKARITSLVKEGDVLFAGTDENGVFISIDGGLSWTAKNTGLTDLHIFNLASADAKLYAITLKKNVFVSDINDINWTKYVSDPNKINCLLQVGNLLFGGTDANGVYLSDNSGQSWVAVNSGISDNTRIWDMQLSNDYIFAGTSDGILRINPDDINNYTVTATANAGGTISPEGDIVVYENDSKTYNITPTLGYKINNVLVDGSSVGVVYSYEFKNVTADHTISVEFLAVPIYTITASSQVGGTITPSGAVQVSETWSKEFTITTSPGHAIDSVLVDGTSVGAVSSYTFTDIASNHTISVLTKEAPYIITASATEGGEIYPSGDVEVWGGSSPTFSINASDGYEVSGVLVDGVFVGALTSYTFSEVDGNHTISVLFASLVQYQINCGSNSDEAPFIKDVYYQGGETSSGWGTVSTTDVNDPAPSAVYLKQRRGNFKYIIPNLTSEASYKVRLHFSDNTFGGGRGGSGSTGSSSTFNVIINGTTVLSDYHIYTAAGATYKAVIEEIIAAADTDGQLVIEFVPTMDGYNATVAGIEIIKQ